MKIAELAKRLGIKMTCRRSDTPVGPSDMPRGSNFYRCCLRRGRRRMCIPFATGPGSSRDPDVADVLGALASDASSIESARSFEDWASDLGLDPDRRSAEKLYKRVQRQTDRVRDLLADRFDEFLRSEE